MHRARHHRGGELPRRPARQRARRQVLRGREGDEGAARRRVGHRGSLAEVRRGRAGGGRAARGGGVRRRGEDDHPEGPRRRDAYYVQGEAGRGRRRVAEDPVRCVRDGHPRAARAIPEHGEDADWRCQLTRVNNVVVAVTALG